MKALFAIVEGAVTRRLVKMCVTLLFSHIIEYYILVYFPNDKIKRCER